MQRMWWLVAGGEVHKEGEDKIMSTIELLENGRVQLNVYKTDGWIHHDFPDMANLEKYFRKATKEPDYDVVI